MAAEAAQAEVPAPPPPPAPGTSPEKRVLPTSGQGEEELPPEPKRRRACVAALDGVACPATRTASGPGSGRDADGASFSFQQARDGFVALETTPKFGSFNFKSLGGAEQAGLDVKPAPPGGEGPPEADEQVPAPSPGSGAEEDGDEGENSRSQSVGVEAGGGQGHKDENDDPVLTC